MSQLAEQQIRDADSADLDRWIAERRDELPSASCRDEDKRRWRWDDYPSKGGHPAVGYPVPPPYASEWWAAGPLLEELQLVTSLTSLWKSGPADWGMGVIDTYNEGTTAPEAIAKVWLLAYERGLIGGVE